MKIVTRKELLAMPAGTIYHQCAPCHFLSMCVKGATVFDGEDWEMISVPDLDDAFVDAFLEAWDKGVSVPMLFDSYGRDAIFDDSLRYAVWESDDLQGLLAIVNRAIQVVDFPRPA